MELTAPEGRVLGALVEKELTTPQAYPLTDNALLAACNQTTSRDPVVSYDVATVRLAVRSLREQGLLRTVHRTGERSDKHRHELSAALELSAEQVAVLAVLLLRGPQTAAEVRARTERMHAFGSVEQVEQVLSELAGRDESLAARMERQPGRKEARWTQLLVAADPARELAAPAWAGRTDPARPELVDRGRFSSVPPAGDAASPGEHAASPDGLAAELTDLREEVARLRDEVAELRARIDGR